MGKTIGIDLGTTNSCVSVMEGGKPSVIPNSEGARTTPSMVAITENGDRLVGQVAKRQAVTNPEHTVFAVKRYMGRRFDDQDLQLDIERAPYKVMASERGDAWVEIREKGYSPPEISAMILQRMKEVAEDYLGEPVESAIVTVPAYFNDSQRQATRDAGTIAGLEVERIVNEPTAAALAYGLENQKDVKIAVYDMGGGTFDISILELSDGVFNVRATNGDTHLGGEDFDQALVGYLCDEFQEANDLDLRKDKMALQRIKEAAEKAKHELSSSLETEVNLPFIAADATGPKHVNSHLTRTMLEELTEDLIERSLEPCAKAMADSGLKNSDIDEVLLVGGMTRMPLIQAKVTEFFDTEPNREINPDEVVARGAAVQGAVLSGDVKNVLLLDVTPLSLGVETAGGVFTPLISRNTTVPTRKSQVFSTAQDNQPVVNVHVLQGERPLADDNKTLARFELVGIPPAPRGAPQIEVAFEIDANGIVSVSAKDLGTGKEQTIRVTAQSGLTDDEISGIVEEADQHRNADEVRKRLVDLRNQADGLIYTTQRSVEEYGEQLDPTDLELIKADLEALQVLLEGEDTSAIDKAFQSLEASAYRIAETIYGG